MRAWGQVMGQVGASSVLPPAHQGRWRGTNKNAAPAQLTRRVLSLLRYALMNDLTASSGGEWEGKEREEKELWRRGGGREGSLGRGGEGKRRYGIRGGAVYSGVLSFHSHALVLLRHYLLTGGQQLSENTDRWKRVTKQMGAGNVSLPFGQCEYHLVPPLR